MLLGLRDIVLYVNSRIGEVDLGRRRVVSWQERRRLGDDVHNISMLKTILEYQK